MLYKNLREVLNMELDWITPQQAAEKWGITNRRVQALCANGQVEGVVRINDPAASSGVLRNGGTKVSSPQRGGELTPQKLLKGGWMIPKGTPKPPDGRSRNGRKPTKNNQE
jgi:hypothetical protein